MELKRDIAYMTVVKLVVKVEVEAVAFSPAVPIASS